MHWNIIIPLHVHMYLQTVEYIILLFFFKYCKIELIIYADRVPFYNKVYE